LLVLDGTLIPSFDFRERVSCSGKHHTMGVKASIIVDATGIPLGVNIAPGSWNDMKLAAQPAITVPAVTLDGLADGNFPATDGSTSARHFTGPRVHHQVPNAGHNLPQEAPDAFASAVLELAHLRSQSAGV